MTKSEFVDWKRNLVTVEVFHLLRARREEIKEKLAYNAGRDSFEDARLSGAIMAIDEMLDVDFEESHGN